MRFLQEFDSTCARSRARVCLLSTVLLGTRCFLSAAASEPLANDGWKCLSPREELRPSFQMKPASAPGSEPSLIIQADDREGLDGHWTKTFTIKGGEYYRFHSLRRVENVTSPRRSTLARILWRDAKGQPVRHD